LLILGGDGSGVSVWKGVRIFNNEFIGEVGILWEDTTGAPVVAFIDNITLHPIPEPATTALLAVALLGLALVRGRRRGA
jgi:hypothetical protein